MVENTKYIEFLEETGAEHVGTFAGWAYFRKRTAEENFKLFSDNTSRIKHLTRVINFIIPLFVLNLYVGCYNLFLYFYWWHSSGNIIGVVNLLISAFIMIGLIRLFIKRNKLKSEQKIFE